MPFAVAGKGKAAAGKGKAAAGKGKAPAGNPSLDIHCLCSQHGALLVWQGSCMCLRLLTRMQHILHCHMVKFLIISMSFECRQSWCQAEGRWQWSCTKSEGQSKEIVTRKVCSHTRAMWPVGRWHWWSHWLSLCNDLEVIYWITMRVPITFLPSDFAQ